jgi:hypothetical protein
MNSRVIHAGQEGPDIDIQIILNVRLFNKIRVRLEELFPGGDTLSDLVPGDEQTSVLRKTLIYLFRLEFRVSRSLS